MDDGAVLRADVYLPVREARYPVILSCGPTARATRSRRATRRPGAPHGAHPEILEGSPTSTRRGAGRSREMGAGGLRGGARRLARRRRLAGNARSLVARDEGPLRLHRVGGRAVLVERQGRLERHLLLRDERVAGGACSRRTSPRSAPGRARATITAKRCATAASPRASSPTGSRAPCIACSTAWASAARRAAVTGEPVCGYDRIPDEELRANRPTTSATSSSTRSTTRTAARARPTEQGEGAVPFRRQLGRAGPAHARQLRGLHARRLARQVARCARRRALGKLLYARRRAAAEALLRPFPQGRRHRLGEAAARRAQGAPPARSSSCATRTNGRSSARAGRASTSTPAG